MLTRCSGPGFENNEPVKWIGQRDREFGPAPGSKDNQLTTCSGSGQERIEGEDIRWIDQLE